MNTDVASTIIDLLGALYRNLVRDESDGEEIGSGGGPALLSVLRRTGGCTMTELSRHLRVSKPNVTFLVDNLESKGLATRERDPNDRRVAIIRLTPTGRAGIEAMRTRAHERVRGRLALLSRDDRAYVEEAVPRVLSILSTLYPPDPAAAKSARKHVTTGEGRS